MSYLIVAALDAARPQHHHPASFCKRNRDTRITAIVGWRGVTDINMVESHTKMKIIGSSAMTFAVCRSAQIKGGLTNMLQNDSIS